MSANVEQLALELLSLPASTRGELALRLIRSLEATETPDAVDSCIEKAKKRSAEITQGKAKCVPAEEVFRKLRDEVG